MLALSDSTSYIGGGTRFDVLRSSPQPHRKSRRSSRHHQPNDGGSSSQSHTCDADGVLHLEQGSLVLFDAGLYHSGVPITSGTRYLLVGFCFADTVALRTRGNLNLQLERVLGTNFPFGVYGWRPEASDVEHIDATQLASAARVYARLCDGAEQVPIHERHRGESPQRGTRCPSQQGGVVKAQALLAQFARQVFRFHVSALGLTCNQHAAAEYWVQMLDDTENIPWHRDKDEAWCHTSDRDVHPAVATVTYLSPDNPQHITRDIPTIVFPPLHSPDDPGAEVLVSFPTEFKHLAFEGSLVHGCPRVPLSHTGASGTPDPENDGHASHSLRQHDCSSENTNEHHHGRHARLTLLVNVWPKGMPSTMEKTGQDARPCRITVQGECASLKQSMWTEVSSPLTAVSAPRKATTCLLMGHTNMTQIIASVHALASRWMDI
eukprot:m.1640856 g.1640856  ORF g.1640856 m.1640856 type:complete len:435 (+) comp44151_c0_seq1:53-1357(+)